ncbi:MAG: VWA domain-containing protein, partial [Candidatus Nanopelagicales bacterium]
SDLREMLQQALDTERRELFPDPSDDARFAEAMLDALPDDVPRAMQELDTYAWRSEEARSIFEQMKDRLRRDVIDQQFTGLTQAVQDMSDPSVQAAMAEMMNDLNDLLDKHRQGTATEEDYQDFMDKHRDFFPNAPETLDEFIDEMARQSAAMQRMLESMTPEQRAELAEAMQQVLSDMGLQEQMARLQENLGALRPEFSRTRGPGLTGENPLGLPDATRALAEMADLEALASQLSDADAMSDLDQIDAEALERALGRGARDDLEAMQQMQRELETQGFLTGEGDSLRMSPKAIRRIGRTALREVFDQIDGHDRGNHDMHRTGAAGEPTGTHREWRFGDEESIDVVRTVQNATRRRLASNGGANLHPGDFEISETETVTRAAVALLVDQSFSMVMNDTWSSAKTMALALHSLTATSYPLDTLQVIGFANMARVVDPIEIPDLEASQIQGTNLQHALMLAGRFLDKHPGSQRIVMVVTDGEPTAHLSPDGGWWFDWPPTRETITQTVAQVDAMTKRKVPISWFRLGDEPRLARFLDEMARRNGGKVLAPATDRLGDYVITDYMRARTRVR